MSTTSRCNKCRTIYFGDPLPSVCPNCGFADSLEPFRGETMEPEQYLKTQISGDSWEAVRLNAYAAMAEQMGYAQVGIVLRQMAQEEFEHASGFVRHSEFTNDRSEMMERLKRVIEGKKGSRKLKIEGSSQAGVAEDLSLQAWFRTCADDERRHVKNLEWCLKQLQKYL
ncbi:rubrerythrin family protein [Desulfurispira natronophila]|uniref:Rubrerythrin n=1 Tax=Desulfurispira natronophila TaxID=682562 RepID=A0A7W8DGQ8_9BACT|nr:rubrerythrin family protein [Desulfurispira natronophila]MBB5021513.1 rubrerythrin [Desulfurispira natronophila]